MINIILYILPIMVFSNSNYQGNPDNLWDINIDDKSNDCICCSDAYKQFQFWVGKWDVYDTEGVKVGENTISIEEDSCLMIEKWQGVKGTTGTSMNYYDKTDSTWNQVWVDNRGSILKLKGEYENGRMVMRSENQKGQKLDCYYNEITWSLLENKTVTQTWTIYDCTGVNVATVFKGIYHKKKFDK